MTGKIKNPLAVHERLIFFVIGVIVSAMVSELLEGLIAWKDTALVLATVGLAAAAVLVLSETYQRLQTLAGRMGMTVHYVSELYEEDGRSFEGKVFQELAKMVGQARREILAMSTSRFEGRGYKTSTHKARRHYLRTLESVIRRSRDPFRYIRIQQVEPSKLSMPMAHCLDQVTREHFQCVFSLARTPGKEQHSLHVMKVGLQRVASFMIIDDRYLVLEDDGVDADGIPYAAGMLFIDDREGTLVKRFRWYFENAMLLAQRVSLEELE